MEPAELLEIAARRRKERHDLIRAEAAKLEAAGREIERSTATHQAALQRHADATAELAKLLDREDCFTHGDTLLELNAEGGLRIRHCVPLGLL